MIREIFRKSLNILGLELRKSLAQESTMRGGLYRQKLRDDKINTVIDIGASNGCWSELCNEFFPNANYLLIEAQQPHESGLKKVVEKNPKFDYVLAAASNRKGEIYFDNFNLWGGTASDRPFKENCIKVPATTIDSEIKERGLRPPFLIKLDTHGNEMQILEGAKESLNNTNLLIIETYNFKINDNAFKYYEMCVFLEKIGFLPIDVVDIMLRIKDSSLWQMDTFYIPSNSKCFENNFYE